MSDTSQGADQVAQWRNDANSSNPAGPLFNGEFAEADITADASAYTAFCGSNCTWSITRYCC
jgi:hypothetical protein